ncbi:hypothetical protein LNV08_20960 [Paucibacter sp. TC2R-5]|uniref:hypothetical protein n=1 Tax=Paucibacter sp. TC2R-5 TaxID=2893555 RepID=UPI0021E473DE|nr:hypothetical protein [Paucibacter sp. TC2R-5]MCV2361439.1 hypothetical protein [Paucibacter sp. TC2R-5]
MSDWIEAKSRANQGAIELLAAFVERYGVHTEEERRFVAAAIMRRPDARKSKLHTEILMDELDSALRNRSFYNETILADLQRRLNRVRQWLVGRGWSKVDIDKEFAARNCLNLKRMTMDQCYSKVADRHGLTVEALKRAHIRRNKAKATQP